MTNKIAVKVSGSIAALLFFEHANSSGDQEGFLLGEMITRTTRTISDSHMPAEKEEISIHIYTILPCDKESFSFYDGSGGLQEEKLLSYIKDRERDVIGWYKFRRNTSLEISLREQAVHENLLRTLDCHNFLFGIFTSCNTLDSSTYTFDHIILRSTRLGFERSSLNIINLGTTSHAEYLHHPHDAMHISTGCFREAVNTVGVGSIESVNHVLEMHKELRLRLESVKDDVAMSEEVLGSMCLHVAELEAKVQTLQASGTRNNEMQRGDHEDKEQESAEESAQCEGVKHLTVSVPDDLEQNGCDLHKDNASAEESLSISVNGSLNTVKETKQNKIICANSDDK